MKDVLGKHVPAGLASIGQWQGHVKAGKIRPLVVVNEERVAAFPDVPTAKKVGFDFPIQHRGKGHSYAREHRPMRGASWSRRSTKSSSPKLIRII